MSEEISKKYLKEKQYKSTQYLEARIKIHQFTKNKIGFHEWIFNQYDLNGYKVDSMFYYFRNSDDKLFEVNAGTKASDVNVNINN